MLGSKAVDGSDLPPEPKVLGLTLSTWERWAEERGQALPPRVVEARKAYDAEVRRAAERRQRAPVETR